MRRENFTLAGIVDAALMLRDIVDKNYAKQILLQEGVSDAVVERVLGDDPSVRRSRPHMPVSAR